MSNSKFFQTKDLYGFSGGPLSNWSKSPFNLDVLFLVTEKEKELRNWSCAEQAFMACKALVFNDLESYKKICKETNPFKVKILGRAVEHFDSDVWTAKLKIFIPKVLYCKFAQHKASQTALFDTGNRIIAETSAKDTIWGIGLGLRDPRALKKSQWRGTNFLGEMLMEVRTKLKQENASPFKSFECKSGELHL